MTSELENRIDTVAENRTARPGMLRRDIARFAVWFAALLCWEILLRLCTGCGVKPGNLTLIVFLPAEALFLTILPGLMDRHRVIGSLVSLVFGLGLFLYYSAQLVYHRMADSFLSVGMAGLGGQAMEEFGWTMRGTIMGALKYLPLFLLPVLAITAQAAFRGRADHTANDGDQRDSQADERATRRKTAERRVFLVFRLASSAVCLVLTAALWLLGGWSLALLGQGRDSAWYAWHSELTDTDTSVERIGALATTLVEGYTYLFGQDRNLAETVTTEVDFSALSLAERDAAPGEALMTGIAESKREEPEAEAPSGEQGSEAAGEETPYREWKNDALDFAALGSSAEKESVKVLCDYFSSRRPTGTNEYTGLFEGYNLICLCCEAFSGYGIDEEITPLLYRMANNGIVLDNFYNSFPNTTTNGEFAFALSLWPDVSRSARGGSVAGSFPQSSAVFLPYGLGDLFSAAGYSCHAYHNYRGEYYMRDFSWPNLGYEEKNIKFLGRGMTFTSAWPASDLEMMEQSVDDYVEEDRFHAYYMTFSGHGPYDDSNTMFRKNIARVRELAGGRFQDEQILGYFCGEYELELAMEYLTKRLEEAGKLENTVIVLIGDHYPYYLSDQALKELAGGSLPTDMERSHSTCIIYNAGMQQPVKTQTYCCNVDVVPTLLNLFGIDFDSRLLMGTDVFSDGVHRARLYNGSFLTELVSYDRTTGETKWSEAAAGAEEGELEAYLEAMLDYTESEYAVSLGMMENDFYFYVWENAGLLTKKEAKAEQGRQKRIRSVIGARAEEERLKAEEEARLKAEEEAAQAAEAAGEEAAQNPAEGEAKPPGE